uniref:Uncharacterized protein n=1 Tax=Utricularia reniformis TaxID=192314 RepID=A0A1Y0B0K7_9LAMI|nr:hypothetical protein AEK19_MT0648 [Utricularia reniformis]ART30901.1 hypothetical protein AEK19_MT0648 [Utricularia reniformis]
MVCFNKHCLSKISLTKFSWLQVAFAKVIDFGLILGIKLAVSNFILRHRALATPLENHCRKWLGDAMHGITNSVIHEIKR